MRNAIAICLLTSFAFAANAAQICGSLTPSKGQFFIVDAQGESCEVEARSLAVHQKLSVVKAKQSVCVSGDVIMNDEDKGCLFSATAVKLVKTTRE